MSVWDNYQGAVLPPPGTPSIELRRTPQGGHVVLVEGQPAHHCGGYTEARLWVQNTYRLTSTMYLPIHEDYERVLLEQGQSGPAITGSVEIPNKYRKQSA